MAQGSVVQSSVVDPVDDQLPSDVESGAVIADGDEAELAVEAQAREMGWKPLAEYRGPAGKWKPAAEFVQRGEEILPIVRDQNRRLGEKVGKLELEVGGLRSTVTEQLQVMNDLRAMAQRAEGRGYDRAMTEIKAQKRKAVESGDTAMFDQLESTEQELRDQHEASGKPNGQAVPATAEPAAPAAPKYSQAVTDFVAANRWFNSDQFLTRKVIDAHIDVIQEGEITDEAQQLAEAKRRIQEQFPARFGLSVEPRPEPPAPRPRPRAAAVAQPSAGAPAPRPGAQPAAINSIQDPAERAQARDAFNRMKRQLPNYTEAEYMALYADPHADVLTLQQQPAQPQR